MKTKTVFKNLTIVTQNDEEEIIHNGVLCVEKGIITYVGSEYCYCDYDDSLIIDMKGKVIIPGLINSHTHCQSTSLRGNLEGFDLDEYLHVNEIIRDGQSVLQRESSTDISIKFGLLDSIKNGNTTVCTSSSIKYAGQYGIRLFTGPLVMNIPRLNNTYEHIFEFVDNLMSSVDFHETFPVIFIHSLYRIEPKILNDVRALMKRYPKLLMTIHIAETTNEIELIKKEYDKTPIELLHSFGLLTSRTLLVHCCNLSGTDVDLIIENDARIAICPLSNVKLGQDIPNIPVLIDKKVKFCIATDSIATNNTSNLLLNARITYYLVKQKYDYNISGKKLLNLITKDVAEVLGRPEIGCLRKGCMADFVAIDCSSIDMQPENKIIENLIFSSNNDITDVVIGGKYYLKDKKLQISGVEKIIKQFNQLSVCYSELIEQYNKCMYKGRNMQ